MAPRERMVVGVFLLASFSAGCRNLRPQTPKSIDPASDASGYPNEQFQSDLRLYRSALGRGDIDAATPTRDRMVARIRLEIDANFHEFEMRLYEERAGFDTGADWVEFGLAGAVTATGGEATKTVLGAVLTAVKGAHLSVDKNWFREKTTEALLAAMQADRDKRLVVIMNKMTEGDASQYSFEEAWADLAAYFYAGTLENGLQALASQAGKQAEDSKAERKTAEDDRAAKFDLRRAELEEIETVENLTDRVGRLVNGGEKGVEDARKIIKRLHLHPPSQESPFETLQAQIRALKAGDSAKQLNVSRAFKSVMDKK